MSRHEKLIKNKSSEDASAILLTNYLQNNADYLSQIYGQISELSIKRINFNMELKNLDSEIINYQTLIDQLNAKKEFISNLIVISPPKISRSPISPNKKQIMIISIAIGLILGASAAFSKEYLSNNFRKAN